MIEILDMKPLGHYANGQPYYRFGCSFPHVKALETGHETKESAWADARKWAVEYEKADVFGNMACALGVTEKDGKFFGVVNFYHSNT